MQDACKLTNFRRYLAAAITQNSWGGGGGVGECISFLFPVKIVCASV